MSECTKSVCGAGMSESVILGSPESIDAYLANSVEPWERASHGVRFVLCDAGCSAYT